MGSFSLFHWIIVAAVILLLFGRGRIADVMGDFGKGISSFKKGMAETEREIDIKPAARLDPPAQAAAQAPVQPAQSSATPVGPAADPKDGT
jgi:sec-independent protein translocase protein TatA